MEREDLQAVVDLTAEEFGGESIPVKIKPTLSGRANEQYITLPRWIRRYAEAYQIYYAVHEICHYLVGYEKWHNIEFKKMEDKALAVWGIKIKRAKVYPKAMTMNGQSIKCP